MHLEIPASPVNACGNRMRRSFASFPFERRKFIEPRVYRSHVVFHFYAKYGRRGEEGKRKRRKELGKNRNVKLGEPAYNWNRWKKNKFIARIKWQFWFLTDRVTTLSFFFVFLMTPMNKPSLFSTDVSCAIARGEREREKLESIKEEKEEEGKLAIGNVTSIAPSKHLFLPVSLYSTVMTAARFPFRGKYFHLTIVPYIPSLPSPFAIHLDKVGARI